MSTGDDGKLWPLNQLQTVPTDLAVKPKEVLGHGLACISGDEISR